MQVDGGNGMYANTNAGPSGAKVVKPAINPLTGEPITPNVGFIEEHVDND